MSMETMISSALLETVKNALLSKGDKPFTMPWPWPDPNKGPDVTAEERAAIHASLDSRSAFGQIRQN